MLSFKEYLVEYLTDKQKTKLQTMAQDSGLKDLSLFKSAKARTDHFFGRDSDIKHEKLIDYEPEKSEVHRQLEFHLGKPLSPKEYQSGLTTDNYGRSIKIGRLIKDKTLRDRYASDSTREGAKMGDRYSVSVVRGIEVGGQTNRQETPEHPHGHSWKDQSCKEVDWGSARDHLIPEIKHGTVVVRVHDSNGQEIHRSTLQPFIHKDDNLSGNNKRYMYAVNSSYGVMHPSFVKHAEDVARRLTKGSLKPSMKDAADEYVIHPHVYDDQYNGYHPTYNIHPDATSDQLMHAIKTRPGDKLPPKVFDHDNVTEKHLTAAINRTDFNTVPHINQAVAISDKLTPEHINKAIDNNADSFLAKTLRFNKKKISQDHIDRMADKIIAHHESGYRTKHPLTDVMNRYLVAGGSKWLPFRLRKLKSYVPDIGRDAYAEKRK